MGIVADEVGGTAVDRTQEEGDVVLIDGIVPEVEVSDFDDFGEKGEVSQEDEDGLGVNAAFPQLHGVFRGDVFGDEKGVLAFEPAVDEFAVRAGGGLGFSCGDGDRGVEDGSDHEVVRFL